MAIARMAPLLGSRITAEARPAYLFPSFLIMYSTRLARASSAAFCRSRSMVR